MIAAGGVWLRSIYWEWWQPCEVQPVRGQVCSVLDEELDVPDVVEPVEVVLEPLAVAAALDTDDTCATCVAVATASPADDEE